MDTSKGGRRILMGAERQGSRSLKGVEVGVEGEVIVTRVVWVKVVSRKSRRGRHIKGARNGMRTRSGKDKQETRGAS